jgi:hypoxanthine phosphoribosyltransferase
MMDGSLDILIDEAAIRDRVREMAEDISRDYAGKKLLLISILKGASIFTADLARRIAVPVEIEFVTASSYGDGTASSGTIRLESDIRGKLAGRHVLLVDGIVDSGKTAAFLLERYWKCGPASLRVAVLLDKRSRRVVDVPIDYRGFDIPDRFVVGYGMDSGENYRNLPYIAVVKEGF